MYSGYKETISSKLSEIETIIKTTNTDYSIANLEKLSKALRDISDELNLYGEKKWSRLMRQHELNSLVSITNFYYNTSQSWLVPLEQEIGTLTAEIAQNNGEKSMDSQKRKIVIVDDDTDILNLLSLEFGELGFDIITFQKGSKALEFLSNPNKTKDVFLLILDRVLPDMDGLDLLKSITATTKQKIPTIFLSVLGSEQDIVSGIETGAIDYIAKPFSVFLLVQKALNLIKTEK